MKKQIGKRSAYVQVGFLLEIEKHRALKSKAAAEGLTVKALLISFIEQYLLNNN